MKRVILGVFFVVGVLLTPVSVFAVCSEVTQTVTRSLNGTACGTNPGKRNYIYTCLDGDKWTTDEESKLCEEGTTCVNDTEAGTASCVPITPNTCTEENTKAIIREEGGVACGTAEINNRYTCSAGGAWVLLESCEEGKKCVNNNEEDTASCERSDNSKMCIAEKLQRYNTGTACGIYDKNSVYECLDGDWKKLESCDMSQGTVCINNHDEGTASCNFNLTIPGAGTVYNPVCTINNGEGVETALGCVPIDMKGFITWLLGWLFGVAGGIAFILMVAGFIMVGTSSGDEKRMAGAKETITSAVIGLSISIFALFLLKLIAVDILHIPGI